MTCFTEWHGRPDGTQEEVPQWKWRAVSQRAYLAPSETSGLANSYSHSGYIALAVVSEKGTLSRDLNTGLGGDRTANMVAFAVAALKLVEEFIRTGAGQGGKI